MLNQQAEESGKQHGGHRFPQLHREQVARREQGANDIQAPPTPGIDHVTLTNRCPSAAIGLGLRKTRFIHIRDFDFTPFGRRQQFLDF